MIKIVISKNFWFSARVCISELISDMNKLG